MNRRNFFKALAGSVAGLVGGACVAFAPKTKSKVSHQGKNRVFRFFRPRGGVPLRKGIEFPKYNPEKMRKISSDIYSEPDALRPRGYAVWIFKRDGTLVRVESADDASIGAYT